MTILATVHLPMNRHQIRCGARQIALRALYSQMSSSDSSLKAVQVLCSEYKSSSSVENFAKLIVNNVDRHINEVDALIKKKSMQWSPERIARIDRIILRISIVELLYIDDVPARVAIDEAVTLAREHKYCKIFTHS